MTVQSSGVALSRKLEAFSRTTAQLSNGQVTCNQCELLRIAKRLQRSGFKHQKFSLFKSLRLEFIETMQNVYVVRSENVEKCRCYSAAVLSYILSKTKKIQKMGSDF